MLQRLLGTVGLNADQWLLCLVVGFAILPIAEVRKLVWKIPWTRYPSPPAMPSRRRRRRSPSPTSGASEPAPGRRLDHRSSRWPHLCRGQARRPCHGHESSRAGSGARSGTRSGPLTSTSPPSRRPASRRATSCTCSRGPVTTSRSGMTSWTSRSCARPTPHGLEQWRPVMKATFPLAAADVAAVFEALRLEPPALTREAYSLDQFTAELADPAARCVRSTSTSDGSAISSAAARRKCPRSPPRARPREPSPSSPRMLPRS